MGPTGMETKSYFTKATRTLREVLRISSDGDDRIRAKITLPHPPPKKPNPKINPQKSHAEFPSLTIKIVQLYINRFCETDAMLCVKY